MTDAEHQGWLELHHRYLAHEREVSRRISRLSPREREVAIEVPGATVCVHRGSGTVVGFRDHAGTVTGSFDETRVGMDHIALAVPSVAELGDWTAWLDRHDVAIPAGQLKVEGGKLMLPGATKETLKSVAEI